MFSSRLPDELWERVRPVLPPSRPRRRRYPGRKRLDDRRTLTGILYVLQTGIAWERLPRELDCGSGMTCWRRLRDWQRSGAWDKVRILLSESAELAGPIDWDRAAATRARPRAPLRRDRA